jgi:hypothetical protein
LFALLRSIGKCRRGRRKGRYRQRQLVRREAHLNEQDFERQLKADGFTEIERQKLDPRPGKGRHRHLFEIRGLVLSGKFVVKQTGEPVV